MPPGAWHYASPCYPVVRSNELQTFTLPAPVLVTGGSLLVELFGRTQAQEGDNLFYTCVAHVRAEGVPLQGWTSQARPNPKGAIELCYTPVPVQAALPSSSSEEED